MRPHLSVTLALALAVAATGCVTLGHPASAQPPPSFTTGEYGEFYDGLSPYGQWVYAASYGWVWHPYGVAGDWRPYTQGHWVYSDDYGWTWVSAYAWGWAPFHYGRWVLDPALRLGVDPRASVWGPAWVAWRWGPGWVGWAPLPPQAYWDPGVGVVYRRRGRGRAHPHRVVVLRPRAAVPVARGSTATSPTGTATPPWSARAVTSTPGGSQAGRPVNVGVPVRQVARVVGHPVRPVRVIEANQAPRRGRPAQVQGDTLPVYRPPRLRSQPAPARPGTPVRPGVRPTPTRPQAQPARPGVRPQPQRPQAPQPARPTVRPQPQRPQAQPARPGVRPTPQRPQAPQPARPTVRPQPRPGAPAARPAPRAHPGQGHEGQARQEGRRQDQGQGQGQGQARPGGPPRPLTAGP